VTVWKLRFRNSPGGMQDLEMEEETLRQQAERNGLQDHGQRRRQLLIWFG
jgi:hypothetical protein